MYKLDLEKTEEPEIANIHWIIEKAREFKKNISFTDYAKVFDCVDHNKLWKILRDRNTRHLTCLLKNLYVGQEATELDVEQHRFKTGKGAHQGCLLSPCIFNFYADHIVQNAGLDESQAGIKTARRNFNNLRYADTTTLMVEFEEQLDEGKRRD